MGAVAHKLVGLIDGTPEASVYSSLDGPIESLSMLRRSLLFAELANQFVGRFKLKLLRVGFELWSMAPVTVSGRLLATAVSQPQYTPISFKDSRGGSIGIWVEIEPAGGLKITTPPAAGEIPTEGDIILF